MLATDRLSGPGRRPPGLRVRVPLEQFPFTLPPCCGDVTPLDLPHQPTRREPSHMYFQDIIATPNSYLGPRPVWSRSPTTWRPVGTFHPPSAPRPAPEPWKAAYVHPEPPGLVDGLATRTPTGCSTATKARVVIQARPSDAAMYPESSAALGLDLPEHEIRLPSRTTGNHPP